MITEVLLISAGELSAYLYRSSIREIACRNRKRAPKTRGNFESWEYQSSRSVTIARDKSRYR